MSSTLHNKNRHKDGYNFKHLCKAHPALKQFIIQNKFNHQDTIDFSNSEAVKALNAALLSSDYQIKHWDIPNGYLCPPIPGRVDYIHYLAELLTETLKNNMVTRNLLELDKTLAPVSVLDIGTGASCIYPILGQRAYDWHFVASDIDEISIKMANKNVRNNVGLSAAITCRHQKDAEQIFKGIIASGEFYHLTMCNPPFHKSLKDAQAGTKRKWQNLKQTTNKNTLNFGGQKAELWCKGGELAFIQKMIKESRYYQQQVLWFTCLVSQKENVRAIKFALKKAKVKQIKVVNMAQGNKISRFIAWTYFPQTQKEIMDRE